VIISKTRNYMASEKQGNDSDKYSYAIAQVTCPVARKS